MKNLELLLVRLEVAVFGCLACAQPWFVANSSVGFAWLGVAGVALYFSRQVAKRIR